MATTAPAQKNLMARVSGVFALATGTPLRKDVWTIMLGVVGLAVPTLATLYRVQAPATIPHPNPTPLGYTWSLTLFAFPVLMIWLTERWRHRDHITRVATRFAFGFIAVWGVLLDFLFGHAFLNFRNAGATIGLKLPAVSWIPLGLVPDYLPVEEFAFYILGGLFLVWFYVWADREWLSTFSQSRRADKAKPGERLVLQGSLYTSLRILGVWLLCVALGILYKRFGNHPHQGWFPGYFVFVMSIGFLPTLLFFRAVHDTVNWKAFALSYLMLLLISVIWEVTLGLPYGWWGYNPEAMLGMTVTAWYDLPLEAVLLWLTVSWVSLTAYEVARQYHNLSGTWKERLFGWR